MQTVVNVAWIVVPLALIIIACAIDPGYDD